MTVASQVNNMNELLQELMQDTVRMILITSYAFFQKGNPCFISGVIVKGRSALRIKLPAYCNKADVPKNTTHYIYVKKNVKSYIVISFLFYHLTKVTRKKTMP